MATLTVNIENKKVERAIKSVWDAFGLNYDVEPDAKPTQRPLSKAEQKVYNNRKRSFKRNQIVPRGQEIELQTNEELLAELS